MLEHLSITGEETRATECGLVTRFEVQYDKDLISFYRNIYSPSIEANEYNLIRTLRTITILELAPESDLPNYLPSKSKDRIISNLAQQYLDSLRTSRFDEELHKHVLFPLAKQEALKKLFDQVKV